VKGIDFETRPVSQTFARIAARSPATLDPARLSRHSGDSSASIRVAFDLESESLAAMIRRDLERSRLRFAFVDRGSDRSLLSEHEVDVAVVGEMAFQRESMVIARENLSDPPSFIVLSSDPDERKAVQAMKQGASDYLGVGPGLSRSIALGVVEAFSRRRRKAASRKSREEIERLAFTDTLTGLSNRRVFDASLARELAVATRHGLSLTIGLADLDRFKQINDQLGHAAGDRALIGAARRIRSSVRDGDLVARIGGDEIALLLPATPRSGAETLARRLHRNDFESQGNPEKNEPTVGFSLGFSTWKAGDCLLRPEELVELADQALYRSKKAGGGRAAFLEVGA